MQLSASQSLSGIEIVADVLPLGCMNLGAGGVSGGGRLQKSTANLQTGHYPVISWWRFILTSLLLLYCILCIIIGLDNILRL